LEGEKVSEISGSHGTKHEDDSLLGFTRLHNAISKKVVIFNGEVVPDVQLNTTPCRHGRVEE
jgi:hypothetical protein